ncbi:NAD(P)H-hydrate dehydratase [Variovorax sp. RHLX14]|uniref:NAD(P)H-hydrate dehydratase n=1 Tax=Variovorax sp. RHLX14 TaxID=1259731 RepID=UPI003F46987D
MQRITSASAADLFDIAGTRQIEQPAAAALPPHTLMRRAGLAVARLAMALAPHAETIWIACGPGNNGGDGLEAAAQLRLHGFSPVVTLVGEEARLPPDAAASLLRAREAGVAFATSPPAQWELAIDALLGIGTTRPPEGHLADWLERMHSGLAPVLGVDVPSGLNADTGRIAATTSRTMSSPRAPRFCLSLLTLKPGLFTADGRDAAGEVWFDDLGCDQAIPTTVTAIARLSGTPAPVMRLHASHKGSYGDVAVIGGAPGMAGAAWMAASAALHGGAGRVFLGLLDPHASEAVGAQPELMLRRPESIDLGAMTVVCGCGGGDAVRAVLPRVISTSARLVLDADALNAIALDPALQTLLVARRERRHPTVLTPHPLEAARLLGIDTTAIQSDRLKAAHDLAARYGTVVVLKGSGSIVAAPGERAAVNLSGNARLATAGTGDVLAGMVGAALAMSESPFDAARSAVWRHGDLADRWPSETALTAGALARGSVPART